MGTESLREVMQLLDAAGYKFPASCPNDFICIVDPACIWPPLLEFINTGWVIITVITGFLLAGWGITTLRGAKHDVMKNLRDLVLIFGVLSVALPAVNMLGAGKAIVGACNVIKVPMNQIQAMLQEYDNKKLSNGGYEFFDIQDSDFAQPVELEDPYILETESDDE